MQTDLDLILGAIDDTADGLLISGDTLSIRIGDAFADLRRNLAQRITASEADRAVLNDCTHGGDCPVHPDIRQIHGDVR